MTSHPSRRRRLSGNKLALLAAALCLAGFAEPEEQPVIAELMAQHASIQPGGKTKVAVHFDIEPGWHIYAKEPGDAGLPTKVAWSSLPGVRFGPLEWPAHQAFLDPGDIRTFGYSGSLVLASDVTYAARESVPEIPVSAHVEWLACREICLPGKADLTMSIPVNATPPVHSTHSAFFDHVP